MTDLILYTTEDGRSQIKLRAQEQTVWLTQLEMAELFDATKQNISLHLKNLFKDGELDANSVVKESLTTASDGKRYQTLLYNLDAILAVGYRVRSPRGVQFRRWASTILKEYLTKGFVMDDERLKNPDGRPDYFDEMLARIRDIRASEKRFYQKVRDLFALCSDYDKTDKATQVLFATVQNLLIFAVTRQTAAELITARANPTDPHFGLLAWKGNRVRKADIIVAKNYLTEDEIDTLNRLVVIFLETAELRAKGKQETRMAFWKQNVDQIITSNGFPLLTHSGTVSHAQMEALTGELYLTFDQDRKKQEALQADQQDEAELQALETKNQTTPEKMTEANQKQLGNTLWSIADQLRGAMDADDFRDYMLSFLFLRYLSDNYETAAKKELGKDYPDVSPDVGSDPRKVPLALWYANNVGDIPDFEKQMRRKVHYVIQPAHLWNSIANMARTQNAKLLDTLQEGFKFIETESFASTFQGLFSEIDLTSPKLGKTYADRNAKLCTIIQKIAEGLAEFSTDIDALGDAYEYLIGQFAAGSGKKAGEFYTPQQISDILSAIVTLDSQEPKTGTKKRLESVMDFACGSGSLLLNVRKKMAKAGGTIGKIFGQEKNITTYNLARMNMLLHGVKDTEFEIFHGDTLLNEWDMMREPNPARKPSFDAIVANPPFSYRWESTDALADDVRFKSHGLAPKSAADFAFLLHGFHYLKDEGVMAIILPHGVLFRGGAEERIRKKLLQDGHIDTVIGLPANLFYSTGIPVCILVLKKCKKPDDVLFINAAEHFVKGKRQNQLTDEHITKIIQTYQFREEEARYSRRVDMAEIEKHHGFNLNISRYISTAVGEAEIDLDKTHQALVEIEKAITAAKDKHNAFLRELDLKPLP